jgi:hypothetical protein
MRICFKFKGSQMINQCNKTALFIDVRAVTCSIKDSLDRL